LKTRYFISLVFFLLLTGCGISASGSVTGEENKNKEKSEPEEAFDASTFIMEHIADSHEWHLYTKKDGSSVAIYLPVILFSKDKGLDIFSSKNLSHGHIYKGYKLVEEGDLKGRIVSVNQEDHPDLENLPLDFSITKAVVGLSGAATIGLLLFLSMARSYKRTGISHPKGIQSFLEPIILFVRDDIAISNIGEHKYEKYMPYLLTVFFFILINNLMGLIPFPPPFGANVTGNIAVTFVLALFTFLITQFSGNRNYWRHTFATPGVPLWLLPVMIPVEIIGIFSKPFALMIRLFANITAGHIIVLSLVCLIFIFKSLGVAPVSILFVIFMDSLELLVAFLQAYVFTLLSALFISLANQDNH
jgi:F-type H+-transporting ATPase subunit a